ncbi:teichuronic acid biosynthesis glycosyltransferase TuaG [Virgibacillus natechei]|uniref:Teichuronic acid biosynthesis glycosyltransferase TuaG n=1 Tax=Virgibacillus natechei TaxID=1216297 RepID=A0ABS4IM43_9BACI|nr:glycosyltransferase family 2 protein [Virgibacillus natechei]MBP1971486.1 teichuronic acid biosynthesis glycosyltransferase TuaG [Virgibacillus natechei]UZD12540.1 glycosyltransferase [Virgibacillus natechei]
MENKQNPLISIITPAYNAEKFISQTIESALRQTYSNWEMILVDDRSMDRTVEYIKGYQEQDDRIKLIKLEENSGSAIARNTAMEAAKGRYFAFLDSDDLWTADKLEKQLRFMQEKDIAFSFTKYVIVQEDGTETKAVTDTPQYVDYDDLMKYCIIGCLTVMLDTDKIGKVEMVNIRTRQDYVLWLTLTKRGFLAYGLPEVLAKYRLVENSISSNKLKAARQNWNVYRHIEKQSLWKSIWYFSNYAFKSVKNIIIRKIK